MSSGGSFHGILQDAALEADVQQVAVHGVGLLGGGLDVGCLCFLAVGDHGLAARELEAPAPGGDDLDVRLQRVGGQLEAHLVVALAGRAVGDGVAPCSLRAISTSRLAMSGRAMDVPSR
jgi:hypothetical protein